MAGLLSACAGCQVPTWSSSSWFPWSKPARPGLTQTTVPSDIPVTVSPEQKVNMRIALAISAERQGRLEEAKKIYQELLKTKPERVEVYHRLGLLHSRQGECQAAENYYHKGLKIDAANAQLHCDLGYNYYLQQNWSAAEASLRQAIALDADLFRARNNLGLLLARSGREAEAMREFASAGADPAQASSNLAFAMALDGRVEHAQAVYRQALEINPNLKAAQEGLATLDSLSADRLADRAAPPPPPAPWGSPDWPHEAALRR